MRRPLVLLLAARVRSLCRQTSNQQQGLQRPGLLQPVRQLLGWRELPAPWAPRWQPGLLQVLGGFKQQG